MTLEIKPLTPALAADYFDFFDNRAFTDHTEWSFCYCTYFHIDKEFRKKIEDTVKNRDNSVEALRHELRDAAASFILDGTIRGYLAYADGLPVGWCNANDKDKYCFLDHGAEEETLTRKDGSEKIKAVTCFTIAPEYRGRGIASALLERVVADAESEGYAAVEGYPRLHDCRDPYDYTGPVSMFEKAGFRKTAEKGKLIIMRRDV
jgi:GNAT superfamily N-acetyltransferase